VAPSTGRHGGAPAPGGGSRRDSTTWIHRSSAPGARRARRPAPRRHQHRAPGSSRPPARRRLLVGRRTVFTSRYPTLQMTKHDF